MAGIVGGGEQVRGVACQGMQFLELTQGEGGKKDMVVLPLASVPFGVFGREEPRPIFQIDVLPLTF
ncbi:hypothetical protein D3C80_1458670 [compost metagenome]